MGTGDKRGILFRKREALIVRAGAEGNAARCPPLLSFPKKEELCPPLPWGRETKGVFSFAKENTPFETPRERPDRQPRSRRRAAPPEWKHLRGGLAPLAAIGSAIRLDLLLLPAAALPILQRYSLISVYRQSHQGGERSNAASRPPHPLKRRRAQQSRRCAGSPPPSHRHSRATECARLIPVTTRRRLVAKPRTPHLIPQAAQLFKLPARNVGGRGERPSSFSGGYKGGILFEKRIPPLPGSGAQRRTIHAAPTALHPPAPPRGRSKRIPSSRREYPLFPAAAQRAARTHAAPAALQPPIPTKGDQRGYPLRKEKKPM